MQGCISFTLEREREREREGGREGGNEGGREEGEVNEDSGTEKEDFKE